MTTNEYIESLNKRFKTGISREHAYRGDLQLLLESLAPDVLVTNEPARIECGSPDYILTKQNIPVGYIEAKDIGSDLGSKNYKEQFDRYRTSLANLVFTDYLDFWFYKDGDLVASVQIGKIENGKIKANPQNYTTFQNLITDFSAYAGQTIRSPEKLSKMMAGKARLMRRVFQKALEEDIADKLNPDTQLQQQYEAFKDVLIHDIEPKDFADIYAQTIAYGMFAARLHDPTLDTFTRQEAAELIPKTNPFLRKLFQYVAGYDLDDRVKWIVDALADIFRATDVAALLKNFGQATRQNDPLIHFYETFLGEYDPKLRKSRGVYYTPEPVVNFIVRAVDDILKTEFGLKDGLADTSKTTVKVNTQFADKKSASGYRQVEQEVHKVQILDPATGTGTFLAEVVKLIHKKFEGQQGIWSKYVDDHLIPRLNGFEILMASYAMAHLKLDLLLAESGYKSQKEQRFKIYLTNSLEEYHPDTGTLFAGWLSTEANEANHIKRDTPVMCVIGNPPYSGESANKGDWIMNLMEDYKKEPGGKEKLKERNPKWINDDYVKFLRYGQHFIEKNGSGVLAFINPHGFLDNPTFRGMRWNLLKTYDKIYTIDLHGNSKKKETALDGSADQNVFDIMQGVSINFFIKTGKKNNNELGKVFHFELFGKREIKYDFLFENSINSIDNQELKNIAPNYFFVRKDYEVQAIYDKGFGVNDLMDINVLGYQTHRDKFALDEDLNNLVKRVDDFIDLNIEDSELKKKYEINESNDWVLKNQRHELINEKNLKDYISLTSYRPFDNQYAILNKAICDRPRRELIQHVLNKDNICLLSSKQQAVEGFRHCFISRLPANDCVMSTTSREANQVFPLYLYPETNGQQTINQTPERTPNLNPEIVNEIAQKLDLTFVPEKEKEGNLCFVNNPEVRDDFKTTFAPIDLLDYIYAVLHSPTYREKYKEFLKIDFPRVPYPKNQDTFWRLVKLGGELREIHLLESPVVEKYITTYPEDGTNVVEKPKFENGKVWINNQQYFGVVPEVAWNFYIGGYQPAQKWLKDRKGRELNFDDILHYQKIIVALAETDRIMKEIDKIEIE